jgi:DNA-binding transcriptional LysR family regulator
MKKNEPQSSGILRATNKALDIDVLRAFVAIVEYGSFTAAAHALHRTQSALSMQMRRLESQLESQLVERRRSGVNPTPAGLALMGSAREMLALNDRVLEARNPAVIVGQVRIGAIEHYATSILPALIAEFCRQYPDVFVETRTGIPGQSRSELAANYDLVVAVSEPERATGTIVGKAKVVWATSRAHKLHTRRPVPLALYPEGALFGRWALDALNKASMPWRIAYRSNNIAALQAAVEAGLGVGVFDEASLPASLRSLSVADGFPPLPRADIWISDPEQNASRATRALHGFLTDSLKRLATTRGRRL